MSFVAKLINGHTGNVFYLTSKGNWSMCAPHNERVHKFATADMARKAIGRAYKTAADRTQAAPLDTPT